MGELQALLYPESDSHPAALLVYFVGNVGMTSRVLCNRSTVGHEERILRVLWESRYRKPTPLMTSNAMLDCSSQSDVLQALCFCSSNCQWNEAF